MRTPGTASNGAFSPNGAWVAFQSNESNRFEIYVQPFPKGDKVRIRRAVAFSRDGGRTERSCSTSTLTIGSWRCRSISLPGRCRSEHPRRCSGPNGVNCLISPGMWTYSVSRDGQRFLVDVLRETVSPITVLLNWRPMP